MATNKHKRILLVDDEKQVLFVVRESLKRLGTHCEIITAHDGYEALTFYQESPFDLVITDVKMPGMDGIRLTEAVRAIDPQIPVIWMTGFGNETIREEARRMEVQYFLAKPLDIADIRQIAREALDVAKHQQTREALSPVHSDGLQERMSRLRNDTGAYAVLLITAAGNPIETVGVTQNLDVPTLSALVAGNFLAAHEIAKMLGRESSFKLSYHESDQHNIYAYGIGKNYLLVTVFGSGTRTGVVWFYTQQAASDLEEIISEVDIDEAVDNTLGHLFTKEVENELNNLLTSVWGEASPVPTNETQSQLAPKGRSTSASPSASAKSPSPAALLSFDEAVAKGIVQNDITH